MIATPSQAKNVPTISDIIAPSRHDRGAPSAYQDHAHYRDNTSGDFRANHDVSTSDDGHASLENRSPGPSQKYARIQR